MLSLAWIKHFDEQTRTKAAGHWCRLLVDNHDSHCTLQFLEYARGHQICVVGYPPHCTHALQGLDVACFGHVKVLWARKLKELHRDDKVVTKQNFPVHYSTVREGAFTESVVLSAFQATGIWPFNPDVIKLSQMAPALESSTEAGAPLPLPPVLQDIVKVLRVRRASTPSLQPAGYHQQGLTTPQRTAAHLTQVTTGTPLEYVVNPNVASFSSATPVPDIPDMAIWHHRAFRNITNRVQIDPLLLSPSKEDLKQQVALLEGEIQYLEETVDTYQATILLQDSYCQAMKRKLYAKETKKKTKRQVLADQGRRDMTHDEWLGALREESTLKECLSRLTEEKKAWRLEEQSARVAANEAIAKEWAEYSAPFKAAHKRPPEKKPAGIKRALTPEHFQEIVQLKEQLSGVIRDGEEEELQGESSYDDMMGE